MMSGDSTNLARCRYCGREFDVRRFQVRLIGNRGVYDSTECAALDDVDELRLKSPRGSAGRGGPRRR